MKYRFRVFKNNINEGSSSDSSKQKTKNKTTKRTIRQKAKELSDTKKVDCEFIVDAKSMTVHHINGTKGDDGLKDNSFDNVWFICSDNSSDNEVVHKLLHYMQRNNVKYDNLMNELNKIRIFKYDEEKNEFVVKDLKSF